MVYLVGLTIKLALGAPFLFTLPSFGVRTRLLIELERRHVYTALLTRKKGSVLGLLSVLGP